jgi:hypothetical protein
MKIAAFWVTAPCSLVEVDDVSEVFSVSIIRAMRAIALIIEDVDKPLKCRSTSARQHDAVFRKAFIFKLTLKSEYF